MSQHLTGGFPSIETAFTDEFGTIDPKVYSAARDIWSHAERLAVELLNDSSQARQLLFKAAARVSRICETKTIDNLPAYLYRSYKNLLFAEMEKENGRRRLLAEHFPVNESTDEAETDLNRKILLNELRRKMDGWTREVYDLQVLGYQYEELVPQYGSAANVIRSRFSKNVGRLARQINAALEEIDRQIEK